MQSTIHAYKHTHIHTYTCIHPYMDGRRAYILNVGALQSTHACNDMCAGHTLHTIHTGHTTHTYHTTNTKGTQGHPYIPTGHQGDTQYDASAGQANKGRDRTRQHTHRRQTRRGQAIPAGSQGGNHTETHTHMHTITNWGIYKYTHAHINSE